VAGIIGMPGRLQSVQAAGFAQNPRPNSSVCASIAFLNWFLEHIYRLDQVAAEDVNCFVVMKKTRRAAKLIP
jgi:hypothetical protein